MPACYVPSSHWAPRWQSEGQQAQTPRSISETRSEAARRVAPIKSSKSIWTFPFCSQKIGSRAILSFPLDSQSGLFFRVGRPHPKGGGQGKDKTIFQGRDAPLIGSPIDLNFSVGQSSLPCTYGELTVSGRPYRSLWHSMMSAGHSASGTSPFDGFIATHGPDRRRIPQATSTEPPGR